MQRLLSLDVIRGVAVLLVIVRHSEAFANTVLAPIQKGGWVAVDLFFVLSGYLVSGLLFREFQKSGSIQPGRFLMRRGWKIYPAFWALIGFTIAFNFWYFGIHSPSKTLVELSFMQSYFPDRWWAHTWSLAVEEHFYLILPFTLAFIPHKHLPKMVFALMAICLSFRLANSVNPFTEQTHLFPTHLRLDGLFFGVLMSYWHLTWTGFTDFCRRYSSALVAGGCMMLIPVFIVGQENKFIHTFGLTINTVASGAILMGLVTGGVRENVFTKTIGWIGFYSYSIYLWHNLVIFIVAPMLGIHNPMIFSLVGSVVFGVGMAQLIEVPAMKLREWTATKVQPTVAVTA